MFMCMHSRGLCWWFVLLYYADALLLLLHVTIIRSYTVLYYFIITKFNVFLLFITLFMEQPCS
jgi:hypothetical protein